MSDNAEDIEMMIDELVGNQADDPGNAFTASEKKAKLAKKIPGDIIESLLKMSEDDLRRRISACEINKYEISRAMKADTVLSEMKDKVKNMRQPYTEAKGVQVAIAEYAAILMSEKGKSS